MSSNSNSIPQIRWGNGFLNTLVFGYPLDNIITYSTIDDGSQFALLQNGAEYGWVVNTSYILEADVRWIPYSNIDFINGWNSFEGWREFLEYGRTKLPFRFYPNTDGATYITSYLVEPLNGTHGLEIDGTRNIRLVIRNNTTPYTGY